jgi:hypothetical protein
VWKPLTIGLNRRFRPDTGIVIGEPGAFDRPKDVRMPHANRDLDQRHTEAMRPFDGGLDTLVLEHAAIDDPVETLLEPRQSALDEGFTVGLDLPQRAMRVASISWTL